MSTLYQLTEESKEYLSPESLLPWFSKSLTGILSHALRETGAIKGLICRPGTDVIYASATRPQGTILPLYLLPIEIAEQSAQHTPCHATLHATHKLTLGPITLFFDKPWTERAVPHFRLRELAQNAEALIERHRAFLHTERRLGIDISSIVLGGSEALRSLQANLAKIAQSCLSVLIEAEFGSDVVAVAAAAHCQSDRLHSPFVTLRCACQQPHEFQRNLYAALKEAAGGSLFLSEVDMLSDAMQRDLLAAISSGRGRAAGQEEDVRLLSASTGSIERTVGAGRFCRFLRAQLDMLRIQVPPLRERKEDIGPLVEYEIGVRMGSRKTLSAEAMQAFQCYRWPGNLGELRQAVSRLAVMSDTDCIALDDVAAHTSLLTAAAGWEPVTSTGPCEAAASAITADADTDSDVANAQAAEALAALARALATGHCVDLTQYGLGVQRALSYMSKHYQTDISLTELAENAYLSASHLSFLFKKMLGVPFKAFLAVVRIEKAKLLLTDNPTLSVTEVSLDSGFGDLSHFERTFKRIVGVNPREYRRRNATQRPANGLCIEAKRPLRVASESLRGARSSALP